MQKKDASIFVYLLTDNVFEVGLISQFELNRWL